MKGVSLCSEFEGQNVRQNLRVRTRLAHYFIKITFFRHLKIFLDFLESVKHRLIICWKLPPGKVLPPTTTLKELIILVVECSDWIKILEFYLLKVGSWIFFMQSHQATSVSVPVNQTRGFDFPPCAVFSSCYSWASATKDTYHRTLTCPPCSRTWPMRLPLMSARSLTWVIILTVNLIQNIF